MENNRQYTEKVYPDRNTDAQTDFVLEMKLWRLHFSNEHVKVLMSTILNKCVVETQTEIQGYFITDWRVYLILQANAAEAATFENCIFRYTNDLISEFKDHYEFDELTAYEILDANYEPFRKFPFVEYDLKKLLLGEPVISLFLTDSLVKLNDFLRHYNFCSVQDYHDCIGPVFVNSTGADVRTHGINMSTLTSRQFDNQIEFAITCVTDGLDEDRYFRRNWRFMRWKGWTAGGYHVLHPRENLVAQVILYTERANLSNKKYLPPIVKIDERHWHSFGQELLLEERILEFLVMLEEAVGRRPIIYAERNTANLHLNLPVFGEYPLWVIDNYSVDEPQMPQAWRGQPWVFWQFHTDKGNWSDYNDTQLFNGSPKQLEAFLWFE